MNLSNRTVWQQASGDTERDYASLCLKFGVILNGYDARCEPPPAVDPWDSGPSTFLAKGSPPQIDGLLISPKKKQDLRRFCHSMQENDVVVLRRGTRHVLGVGVVYGGVFSDENFGDVDGWNLPLGRRVNWFWSGETATNFGTYSLKQGDTTQKLAQGSAVWKWLETLPEPPPPPAQWDPWKMADQREVTIQQISDYLFDCGIASGSIRDLIGEIGELERIASWYQRTAGQPSESETVAYLVVPLLRALGWTPQKMAVEWKNIDVALFARLPRSHDSLRVVVEVKKMQASCLTAEDQARRYAAGREQCHRLILTDGLRYAVHTRVGTQDFKLSAYLNLVRMRDHYPIWNCRGAQEALLLMAPEMELTAGSQPPDAR